MTRHDREQLGEWLSAYVDGELSEEECRQVEQFVRENADAQRLLDELRSTIHAVASLPRHQTPASLADDIQANIERAALIGGLPPQADEPPRSSAPLRSMLSVAAALVVVVTGWWFATYDDAPSSPVDQSALAMRESEEKSVTDENRSGRSAHRRDLSPRREPTPAKPNPANVLLASADFEQKRRAGLGTEAVRTHPFKNETVRLQITVKDEKQRDAVAARVTSYLKNQKLANLEDGKTKAEEFLYQGSPEKNFEDPKERQVLVRASQDKMDGLLNTIEATRNQDYRVAFASGPLSVHGWDGTRMAVQSLGGGTAELVDADHLSDDEGIAATTSMPRNAPALAEANGKDHGPVDSLIRSISNLPSAAPVASSNKQELSTWEAATESHTSDALAQGGQRNDTAASKSVAKESLASKGTGEPSSSDGNSALGTSNSLESHPTLVSRRRKALEEASLRKKESSNKAVSQRTMRKKRMPPASSSDLYNMPTTRQAGDGQAVESYITFVVEVKIAGSKKPNAKSKPSIQ